MSCGDLLSPLGTLDRFRRQGGREDDQDLAQPRTDLDRYPEVTKDLNHPIVLGEHPSDEDADTVGRSDLRQVTDHDRTESAPLIGIGDGQGNLRTLRVEPMLGRDADDGRLGTYLRNQGAVVHVVRGDIGTRRRR